MSSNISFQNGPWFVPPAHSKLPLHNTRGHSPYRPTRPISAVDWCFAVIWGHPSTLNQP
jgi:hypothetical protein